MILRRQNQALKGEVVEELLGTLLLRTPLLEIPLQVEMLPPLEIRRQRVRKMTKMTTQKKLPVRLILRRRRHNRLLLHHNHRELPLRPVPRVVLVRVRKLWLLLVSTVLLANLGSREINVQL